MALSIVVRLRAGRYDAAALRPQVAEWPPAPARVFCALVASARSDADWSALSWMESAGMPEVWAAAAFDNRRESLYVVTNAVSPNGGNQLRLGRSNGQRQRASAVPSDDTFAVVWPDAQPSDATLGILARLAHRVPYVGRSTSSAEVTVIAGPAEFRQGWQKWRPADLGTADAVELGVPYQGYLHGLRTAHSQGQRAWEVGRTVAYVPEPAVSAAPATIWQSPYGADGLVVLGFQSGHTPIGGEEWPQIAETLRQATIDQVAKVGNPVPPQVSGHGADEVPHVAYVCLPHVGSKYADGHLLGVALALPESMSSADRKQSLQGVFKIRQLRFGSRRQVDVDHDPDRVRPTGLLPARWTGGRDGARQWVTATPVMLDRHPKAHTPIDQILADSLVRAGYPEPVTVDLLPTSPLLGGIHRPHHRTIPAHRPRRPWVHCRVTFPVPVRGLVIAGAMRYLGGGLFAPDKGNDDG